MTKTKETNRLALQDNGAAPAQSKTVTISPPNIQEAKFKIIGTAPLVIHRFSEKSKRQMGDKMKEGSTAKKGKKRDAADFQELFNEARYIAPEGWDGFNVSAIRNGIISACRLVGFKMTLAKLSVFVEADGRDAKSPEFGLIRIYGKARLFESVARVETGSAYVCVRPIYDEWSAIIRIRFDGDQFTVQDVANLLARVGEQVGIGEGRPDSKNSPGMGWGIFRIANEKE